VCELWGVFYVVMRLPEEQWCTRVVLRLVSWIGAFCRFSQEKQNVAYDVPALTNVDAASQ